MIPRAAERGVDGRYPPDRLTPPAAYLLAAKYGGGAQHAAREHRVTPAGERDGANAKTPPPRLH